MNFEQWLRVMTRSGFILNLTTYDIEKSYIYQTYPKIHALKFGIIRTKIKPIQGEPLLDQPANDHPLKEHFLIRASFYTPSPG